MQFIDLLLNRKITIWKWDENVGFDLGHTISSVSKFALRTKRRIDKNDESNIKVYELWLDHTYRTYATLTKDGYRTYEFEGNKV